MQCAMNAKKEQKMRVEIRCDKTDTKLKGVKVINAII